MNFCDYIMGTYKGQLKRDKGISLSLDNNNSTVPYSGCK